MLSCVCVTNRTVVKTSPWISNGFIRARERAWNVFPRFNCIWKYFVDTAFSRAARVVQGLFPRPLIRRTDCACARYCATVQYVTSGQERMNFIKQNFTKYHAVYKNNIVGSYCRCVYDVALERNEYTRVVYYVKINCGAKTKKKTLQETRIIYMCVMIATLYWIPLCCLQNCD